MEKRLVLNRPKKKTDINDRFYLKIVSGENFSKSSIWNSGEQATKVGNQLEKVI